MVVASEGAVGGLESIGVGKGIARVLPVVVVAVERLATRKEQEQWEDDGWEGYSAPRRRWCQTKGGREGAKPQRRLVRRKEFDVFPVPARFL